MPKILLNECVFRNLKWIKGTDALSVCLQIFNYIGIDYAGVGVDKPYLDRSRAIYRGSGKPKVTSIWVGEWRGVGGLATARGEYVCVDRNWLKGEQLKKREWRHTIRQHRNQICSCQRLIYWSEEKSSCNPDWASFVCVKKILTLHRSFYPMCH